MTEQHVYSGTGEPAAVKVYTKRRIPPGARPASESPYILARMPMAEKVQFEALATELGYKNPANFAEAVLRIFLADTGSHHLYRLPDEDLPF